MKMNSLNRSIPILLLATALAFVAGCAVGPAQTSGLPSESGHLVVSRSFALAGLPVSLEIDGKRAATIDFNRRFETALSPGPHTLSVVQIPALERTRSAPIQVVVRRGQTYAFVVTRLGPAIVLRPASGS
jgi:hypothetical protein